MNVFFRPGDLARVEAHLSSNAQSKKPKKTPVASTEANGQVDGVVYKAGNMDFLWLLSHLTVMQVSDTRIIVAVDQADSNTDNLDLPERCRVVKLANSITYDR